MDAPSVLERPAPAGPRDWRRPISQWPTAWPLAMVVVGYPLWWLLGVAAFMPFVMAVAMVWQLRGRKLLLVPGGFGWWLVFLVWVVLGVFVLYSDAPNAVPGGGAGRIMVFVYNLGLYVVCTIAVVWISNVTEKEVSLASVARILSWLFVFASLGGVLGVLLPSVDFPSVLELLLPKSFAQNSFVSSLIHPGLSDIQDVLGTPEARPKAPFPYANTWGSVIALSLPFFLLTWIRTGTRMRRVLGGLIGLASLVPIVYSLNRGLWGCLAVGLVFLVLLQVKDGKLLMAATVAGALTTGVLLFLVSPLGAVVGDRLAHQHSNDRREQLLVQTVASAAEGSPIIGFGGTRDVQGSFASIAGTSTPDCPACGVPPLGTQGHLWLVIFAQGLVGAGLFLAFFLTSIFRTWRCRTSAETIATVLVLFFFIQMFVYDTLGIPILLVVLGVGLGWRSTRELEGLPKQTLRRYFERSWLSRHIVGAFAALGTIAGVAFAMVPATTFAVTDYLLLAPSPSYLQTDVTGDASPRDITVDTEAALVMSEQTLAQVDLSQGTGWRERSGISVTAVPNTKVLVITVSSQDRAILTPLAEQLSSAYLETRSRYLENRRAQLLATLQARAAELEPLGVAVDSIERQSLDGAMNSILLTTTSPGQILRSDPPEAQPREFAKYIGTGIACGLLAAVVWVEFGRPLRLGRVRR